VKDLGKAELNDMVAEATVDAYDEDEQLMGFHAMFEEHLPLPTPPPPGSEWIAAYRHWAPRP
jgi:hypothetical protein